MEVDTVIKNCVLVDHVGRMKAGMAIDNGKIVAIAKDGELPPARRLIDAKGNYVIPGVVDAHVHLEYPPGVDSELNIRKETKACAAGGCTTLIHLLAPSDNIVGKGEQFVRCYEDNGHVDLALSARIYSREHIRQIQNLYDFGITSVKLLLPYKGSEAVWKGRAGGIDDGIIYLTFREVGRLANDGFHVFTRVHCENVEIFLKLKEEFLETGAGEPLSWNQVRPRACEEEAIRKCLYLAEITNCPIYIVHMTIKEGIPLLRKARSGGIDVTVETCVQYLCANTDNVDNVLSKVNPPIRGVEDNLRLWEGLREKTIDVVATDHAPVPRKLKTGLWDATVGVPGSETFLPLMLSEGVNKGRISLERMVECCSYSPAEKFGLSPRKGTLSVGSDADIVIIDLEKEASVAEKPTFSGSDFSIFAGWKLKGWPVLTMLRGKIVSKNGEILGEAGYGRFVRGR